jgi:hypothetical protein
MLLATVHCSDEGCAEVLEVVVDDLAELAVLACLCGCTFELLGRVQEADLR